MNSLGCMQVPSTGVSQCSGNSSATLFVDSPVGGEWGSEITQSRKRGCRSLDGLQAGQPSRQASCPSWQEAGQKPARPDPAQPICQQLPCGPQGKLSAAALLQEHLLQQLLVLKAYAAEQQQVAVWMSHLQRGLVPQAGHAWLPTKQHALAQPLLEQQQQHANQPALHVRQPRQGRLAVGFVPPPAPIVVAVPNPQLHPWQAAALQEALRQSAVTPRPQKPIGLGTPDTMLQWAVALGLHRQESVQLGLHLWSRVHQQVCEVSAVLTLLNPDDGAAMTNPRHRSPI